MNDLEKRLVAEMAWLLEAGAGLRTVRVTVYEEMVTYLVLEPTGSRRVHGAVEASLRAAYRMLHEYGAPDDLLDTVLESALDAVRGHGGETSRWIREAVQNAYLLLEQFETERGIDSGWRKILERF